LHYLIDGYNLLFKLFHDKVSLKEQREYLISYLRDSIPSNCRYTLVFDAHLSLGDEIRTHTKDLEVLYTSEKETADEWILSRVERGKGKLFVVVTSDKVLAHACRHLGATIETASSFLKRLSPKEEKKRLKPEGKPIERKVLENVEKPPKHFPPEACFDYYLYIFEKGKNS
jgi:predicted RNA-binding protein with PIN domain